MDGLILIKYGELTTKKDNRRLFINTLYDNINKKLKTLEHNIIKEYSRMYIEYNKNDEDKIINILKNIFGIHAFSVALKTNTVVDEIKDKVYTSLKDKDFKTFKVETKRRDKTFEIKSMDFNNLIGGFILKNIKGIKVDVRNPEVLINIEINKDITYIYLNEIKGLGGYPVKVLGKGLLMLSGGIDSPVAGYLSLKRGVYLDAIYFEAIPHTSINARLKVISLAQKLHKYSNDFNLYVVPITKLQEAIYKNVEASYVITILRRMMYRIATSLAKRYKATVLINGESIGQVASQTLSSISVINEVCNIPVIRPVACFDKLEIIDIAKKIDTYNTSILPYEDCCTVFVPKHPSINPDIKKCLYYESLFDYQKEIDEILDNIMKIEINSDTDNTYSDLL